QMRACVHWLKSEWRMQKRGTMASNIGRYSFSTRSTAAGVAALGALALAGTALIVNRQAEKAEKENPPKGAFVTVDGIRLHYLERGQGHPVVFLHGNALTVEDALINGVLSAAADRSYRAIAIDRPGFGHSERPR